MSDYAPEAGDTLVLAVPQLDRSVEGEEPVIAVPDGMEDEDDCSKENVAPPSSNVANQSPGPATPTKKKTKSGRIGKRELLQVSSPKARWLPRAQDREKRRGRHSISRFEFEEKEAEPLWKGEGRKLEDSQLVVDNIKFFSRNDSFLKQIHHIFYNRACKANEVKANLIAFSGLPEHYLAKAQEKLEAKSVSFLKLLADVLGQPHTDDGKKKTLVADLVAFLSHPKKVRRGVNLGEKAETLKEQRRLAKEKKDKKDKKSSKKRRASGGGQDKKKRKAKATDFYSDIESDDEEDDDMKELYGWDKKAQAKSEEQAKEIEKLVAEREKAKQQKKAEKEARKRKRKESDDDDEDEDDSDDEEEESEDEDEKRKKKKKEAERKKRKKAEEEKKRKKAAEEKKRKIVKAKRKHDERKSKEEEDDSESEEDDQEEEEEQPKRTAKRSREEKEEDAKEDKPAEDDESKEVSRKKRKIVIEEEEEEEEDGVDEAKEEAAGGTEAHKKDEQEKEKSTEQPDHNEMQIEEKNEAAVVEQKNEKVEESQEEKEKMEKTQEAIREALRRYLKEQLTVEEARLQTPKLLRLHVEAVLGHSVEGHATFILQCVRQIFAAAP